EPKRAKLRLHLDVNATDRDQDAELERLLAGRARAGDHREGAAGALDRVAAPEENATDRGEAAELDRLLAAGARPVDIGQTGAESWHVLADPEGNEFCLLRRRGGAAGAAGGGVGRGARGGGR